MNANNSSLRPTFGLSELTQRGEFYTIGSTEEHPSQNSKQPQRVKRAKAYLEKRDFNPR